MSYSEVKKLPVTYRKWYITRLVKHFKDASGEEKDNQVSSNMKNLNDYQEMINKKFK